MLELPQIIADGKFFMLVVAVTDDDFVSPKVIGVLVQFAELDFDLIGGVFAAIDANPLTAGILGRYQCSSAAAKRIQHHIPLIRTRQYNPTIQRQRLLRHPTRTLFGNQVDWMNASRSSMNFN